MTGSQIDSRGGGREGHGRPQQNRQIHTPKINPQLTPPSTTPSLTITKSANAHPGNSPHNDQTSLNYDSQTSTPRSPFPHYTLPNLLPPSTPDTVRFSTVNILGAHTSSGECKIQIAARVALREQIDIMVLTETGMSRAVHTSAAHSIKKETGYSMITTKNYRPWPNTPAHHSGTIMLLHDSWFSHMGQAKTVGDRVLIIPFHFRKSTIWVVGMYQFTSPLTTNHRQAKELLQATMALLSEISNNMELNQFVLLGDLNETMDPVLDRKSTTKTPNSHSQHPPMITQIVETLGLADVFRSLYPSQESYTFSGPSGQSRLDYIFVPGHWIGSTSLATHNNILELTTDHQMVTAEISIPTLSPRKALPSDVLEGLQPSGIRMNKGANDDSWKMFHDLSEISFFQSEVATFHSGSTSESIEAQWDLFSNIITQSAKASIAKPNRIFNTPSIHPCKVFKGDPELLLLRQILEQAKQTHNHTEKPLNYRVYPPDYDIIREGSITLQSITSKWPIPTQNSTSSPSGNSLPSWWDWVDQRIVTLTKALRTDRERLKRRRIQLAVEQRCARMANNLQSSLRSLLERPYCRPSAKLLRKIDQHQSDFISSWEDVEQHIIYTFQNWSSTRSPDTEKLLDVPFWSEIYTPPTLPNSLHNITYMITLKELNRAITASKGGKSPGPSGISYEMLKHLGKHGRDSLLRLFNSIITQSHVPTSWLHHHIVPIPKGPWQGDYNNTRPISLLETSRKTLESILNFRIRNILVETPHLLPGGNFGFIPGDGIEGALSTIREVIADSSENDQELWIAQQDIRRAYDTVSWPSLQIALQRIGMDPNFTKLMGNMWTNRSAQVITDRGLTKPFPVNNGLAQGGVLSPVLWTIFYDPLLTAVRSLTNGYQFTPLPQTLTSTHLNPLPPQVDSVAFADDTTWISSSRTCLQSTLNLAHLFLSAHDLEAHPNKFTILSNLTEQQEPLFFGMDNAGIPKPIPVSPSNTSLRILGVRFSAEGKTNANDLFINTLVSTATSTLSRKWTTPQQILYLANGVINPAITFISKGATCSQTTLQAGDIAWRKLLRQKANLPISTPVEFFHFSGTGGLLRLSDTYARTTLTDTAGLLNSPTRTGSLNRHRLALVSAQSGFMENITEAPTAKIHRIQGKLFKNHWSYLSHEMHRRGLSLIPVEPPDEQLSWGSRVLAVPQPPLPIVPSTPIPLRIFFPDRPFATSIAPTTSHSSTHCVHQITSANGTSIVSAQEFLPGEHIHPRTRKSTYSKIKKALHITSNNRLPTFLQQHKVSLQNSHTLPPNFLQPVPSAGEIVAEPIRSPEGEWSYELYQVISSTVHLGTPWAKVRHFRDTSMRERTSLNITDPMDQAVYRPCDHRFSQGPRSCYNRQHATGWSFASQISNPPFYPSQPPDTTSLGHLCIGWTPVGVLLRVDHLVITQQLQLFNIATDPIRHHLAPLSDSWTLLRVNQVGAPSGHSPDDLEDPICSLASEVANQLQIGDNVYPEPNPTPASTSSTPLQWDRNLLQLWNSSSHPKSTFLSYVRRDSPSPPTSTQDLFSNATAQTWENAIKNLPTNETVTVYTDGSLQTVGNGKIGGGGAVLDLPDLSHLVTASARLFHSWSSRQGEIMGVALALALVPIDRPLLIVLDDKGLVNSWEDYTSVYKTPRQLLNLVDFRQWAQVKDLLQARCAPTSLQWIRGHGSGTSRGEIRNNQADQAAKDSVHLKPPPSLPHHNIVRFQFGVLGAIIPGNTTRTLNRLNHAFVSSMFSHKTAAVILLDNRLLREESSLFSINTLPSSTSVQSSWIQAWRAKAILGLLPTLYRLSRDFPNSYPSAACPLCGLDETQQHLWICEGRSDIALLARQQLLDSIKALDKTTIHDFSNDLPWFRTPVGKDLSSLNPEDQLWISRGVCPRSILQHPSFLRLPLRRQKSTLCSLTKTIGAIFRELIWLPRCSLVPHAPIHRPITNDTQSTTRSPTSPLSQHLNGATPPGGTSTSPSQTAPTSPVQWAPLHSLPSCPACYITHRRDKPCSRERLARLSVATAIEANFLPVREL